MLALLGDMVEALRKADPGRKAKIYADIGPPLNSSPERWGCEMRPDRWIRRTTTASVLLVALIAAIVSFRHMHELALLHGED